MSDHPDVHGPTPGQRQAPTHAQGMGPAPADGPAVDGYVGDGPDDVEPRVLRHVIQDGVASQVMATLTGGPFLVAYALALGASNLTIGLLAAASPLAQVVQFPAVWLIEKFRDRRLITLGSAFVSRLFWIAIAAAAWWKGSGALAIVFGGLLLHFMFGGIAGTAWNSWMRDLIPERMLGSFFARRLAYTTGVALPLFLAAGFAVDAASTRFPGQPLLAYQVLFVLGSVAGFIGLLFLHRTPEPPMPPREPVGLRGDLWRPLSDRNFRKLLHFLVAWNFALNLAAPFFTVYLLQRIGYPVSIVVALTVLSQVVHLLFLRLWGRWADQYGNRAVLLLCGPMFLVAVLAWTFTTVPMVHAYTMHLIIAIHIVLGLATAGTALAASNIVLKLAPRGRGTSYLAVAAVASAVAGAAGPLLGGALADWFELRRLDLRLRWEGPRGSWDLPTLSLESWDFFFATAFVFGAYALHRLTAVEERGIAGEHVVLGAFLSEVRQEMRNLSTVAGIRTLVQFPITLLRTARERRR